MDESLPTFWSFNRFRDASCIQLKEIVWQGPFAWPRFAHINHLPPLPDGAGVYLLTFTYHDGYILRSAGITTSMKRRFAQHTREYRAGRYTVLDVPSATRGERKELWHGWGYAKTHPDEFVRHKDSILQSVAHELAAYHVFITDIADRRMQARLEFAIIQHAYHSKEPWGDLVDGGMAVYGRANDEMPVEIRTSCPYKLYGIPDRFEI